MPGIGKPQSNQKNPYSQIGIQSKSLKASAAKNGKRDLGQELNQVAGRKEKTNFKSAADHNKLGKDGFLKLLATQLKNQDPLQPMDQKKFAADLAQFSQLEQLTNMNSKFDKMGKNAPSEAKFYGASFLGKEVMTKGTSVDYDGAGGEVKLPFFLDKDAKNSIVRIYDSKAQLVAQIEKQGMSAGNQQVTWDGRGTDGQVAVKDNYRFEVLAFDNDFNQFRAETKAKGIVTGVEFENGETMLTIDGKKKIFLRDVESFKLPNNDTASQKMPGLSNVAKSSYNKMQEAQ